MKLIATALCLFIIAGCGSKSVPGLVLDEKDKEKSQLEARQIQTRTYDTKDVKMIMKAMLNVLQDDNFIVKQVNLELGFLNATKEADLEDGWERFWAEFWKGKHASWKKNSIIDCTANVSEFGDQMKVRVNFQVKVLDNKGGCILVQQVNHPDYYQRFFSKVDKGIFIEKEHI